MDTDRATLILRSLASGVRLEIYRRLVAAGPEGMVAGRIAADIGIPANNLTFHLKDMTHARLVSVEQEGRFLRYRANMSLMLQLIAYLTEECCAGHPDQCAGLPVTLEVSHGNRSDF